jgi:hypothetical protein
MGVKQMELDLKNYRGIKKTDIAKGLACDIVTILTTAGLLYVALVLFFSL